MPSLSEVHEPRHGGERDCNPGAELPDLPPSSPRRSSRTAAETYPRRTFRLRLQFGSRSTPAGAAGKPRPQLSSRSTPLELRRCFGGGRSVAVRQLSSGSSIPFSSMSPPPSKPSGRCRSTPAGIVLPELSCRTAAEFPPAGAARPLVHKILAML